MTVHTTPTRMIIGACVACAILATAAITTGAAHRHGLQLGVLLGTDLVIGAGFIGALVAAANRSA